MKKVKSTAALLAFAAALPLAGQSSKQVMPREERQTILETGGNLLERGDPETAAKLSGLDDPFQLYTPPAPAVKKPAEEEKKERQPIVVDKPKPLPDEVVLKLIATQKFKKASSMIPPPPKVPRLVTEAGNFEMGQTFSVDIRDIKYLITIADITVSSYTLQLNDTTFTVKYK